jgi:hypothetical protein
MLQVGSNRKTRRRILGSRQHHFLKLWVGPEFQKPEDKSRWYCVEGQWKKIEGAIWRLIFSWQWLKSMIQFVGRVMNSTSYKCNYHLALLFTFDRCLFCRTQTVLIPRTSPNSSWWIMLGVWKFSDCKQLGLLVKIQIVLFDVKYKSVLFEFKFHSSVMRYIFSVLRSLVILKFFYYRCKPIAERRSGQESINCHHIKRCNRNKIINLNKLNEDSKLRSQYLK